jgi:hypothetical protein
MFGSTCLAALRASLRRPQTWLGLGLWWLAWVVVRLSSPLAIAIRNDTPDAIIYDLVFVSSWLGASVSISGFTRLEPVLRRTSRAYRVGIVLVLAVLFALAYGLVAATATAVSPAAAWRSLGAAGLVAALAFPALVAGALCSDPRWTGARSLLFWSSAIAWTVTVGRTSGSDEHVPGAPFLPILGLALALGTLSLPMRERSRHGRRTLDEVRHPR